MNYLSSNKQRIENSDEINFSTVLPQTFLKSISQKQPPLYGKNIYIYCKKQKQIKKIAERSS